MAIYLWLIAFILGASPIQKQYKKIYLTVSLFFLWIIIAFRAITVGSDTIVYVASFASLANLPLSIYGNDFFSILFTKNRFEYGYVLLNKIIYHFSKNPRWLLIVSATIIVLILGYILYKYSDNPALALVIFVTMGFMSGSMSQIRQYLAWSVCLFSIKYIMQNKPIKFILTIILAMLLHISSIVFLPMYFISKTKFKISRGFGLVVISLPIFLFFTHFSNLAGRLIGSYNNYNNQIANNGTTGYLAITVNFVTILIFLLLSIYLIHINGNKQLNNKLINLSLWMLFCALISTALSYKFSQFTRLGSYFTFAMMFLIPNQLNYGKNITIKKLITIMFITFLILHFIIVHTLRPGWSTITPYHFMSGWWE